MKFYYELPCDKKSFCFSIEEIFHMACHPSFLIKYNGPTLDKQPRHAYKADI